MQITFSVSLEHGFSLKHVVNEPVHKDYLPIKTICYDYVSLERSLYTGFTVVNYVPVIHDSL